MATSPVPTATFPPCWKADSQGAYSFSDDSGPDGGGDNQYNDADTDGDHKKVVQDPLNRHDSEADQHYNQQISRIRVAFVTLIASSDSPG